MSWHEFYCHAETVHASGDILQLTILSVQRVGLGNLLLFMVCLKQNVIQAITQNHAEW